MMVPSVRPAIGSFVTVAPTFADVVSTLEGDPPIRLAAGSRTIDGPVSFSVASNGDRAATLTQVATNRPIVGATDARAPSSRLYREGTVVTVDAHGEIREVLR